MNKEMLMLAEAIALEKNVGRDVVFAAIVPSAALCSRSSSCIVVPAVAFT